MREVGIRECLSSTAAAMLVLLLCWDGVAEVNSQKVPALFVFGDSLVDVGNNNFLNTVARANYYPYGIDFSGGPTGRFCNGKCLIDFIGDLLGVPSPPPFADPSTVGRTILNGVNYASAAAGILDESGRTYGDRYTMSRQVLNFESTLNQYRTMMNATTLSQYLAKSIAVVVIGSNDYINNYLQPGFYGSSYNYTPQAFGNLLVNSFVRQLLALHSVGLRKFFLAGIGPLGCIPNQRASGLAPPGRCVDNVNQMVGFFNEGLRSMVDQLNSNHPGAIFVYGNTYGVFGDVLNNPAAYSFNVIDRACCGIGMNRGQITCLPFQVPCAFRNQYVYWDAFHPTQSAVYVFAWRAVNGPPNDCYPINIQQMALM
ncbi:GDSL esterase/lipase At1g71250-like [Gastrolobium bilobum]|uniref:GDSL esterase/lipase At1g71250-like n=1 Tax=Gastrolobium bilobum TaxID=150636 RepID=UPI002AB18C12|nr:GDSL esterase/lipase At1g71250-like [Gastrolobium bilobum]